MLSDGSVVSGVKELILVDWHLREVRGGGFYHHGNHGIDWLISLADHNKHSSEEGTEEVLVTQSH